MHESKKTLAQDFEAELQNRLNQLSNRRSHKKIAKPDLQPYHPHYYDDSEEGIDRFSKIIEESSIGSDLVANSPSPQKESKRLVSMKDWSRPRNQEKANEEQMEVPVCLFPMISNKELDHFLMDNFRHSPHMILLDEFITKSMIQHFPDAELSEKVLQELYLLVQSEITTTEPHCVSLNALEMVLKRKSLSLRSYFDEKILQAKSKDKDRQFAVKGDRLEGQREELEKRQKVLNNLQGRLHEKEKEMGRREKNCNAKQKQLICKNKEFKKLLQEKADRMGTDYIEKMKGVLQKCEKKINSFQRNLKYKVEGLDRKSNEIHRLREYKEAELRSSIAKELEHKYEKTLGQQARKLQKSVKELEQKNEAMGKEKQELEEEGNKLLKVCAGLQLKLGRAEKKGKVLKEEAGKKQVIIRELEFLMQEKAKENEQLMKKLVKGPESGRATLRSELAESRLKSSKSKKSLRNLSENKRDGKMSHGRESSFAAVQDIMRVYELCLRHQGLKDHQDRDSSLSKSLVSSFPSIEYLISQDQDVGSLIERVFGILFSEVHAARWKDWNTVLRNQDSHEKYRDEADQLICQLESVVRGQEGKIVGWKRMVENLERSRGGWRWFLAEILVCPSPQESLKWLHALVDCSEVEAVAQDMKQELSRTNYVSVMIYKVFLHSETLLEGIELSTDLILNMEVTSQLQGAQVLMEMETYRIFIETFVSVIESVEGSETVQVLEKMSIVIQRLIFYQGRNVIIHNEEKASIQKLLVQMGPDSPGILGPNISSILSALC